MVLKLYGYATAPCTLRVAIVLHEKNIPYEFHTIDLTKGEQKAPAFLEKHPFGQTPYLDDDGYGIYESRAICRYLDAKYEGRNPCLAPSPSDIQAYGLFEQAASVEASNFYKPLISALVEKLFKPMRGVKGNDEVAAGELQTLQRNLDAYEKILSKQKYLAGDEATLVDLFHLPEGASAPLIGFNGLEDGQRPSVARWWKELTSRPAWVAVKNGVKDLSASS
ncbi:glutathione S-transferase [Vararia minispora EC-137]|uniref:Glutathione S-transferase n=1 Tax=Vararia minispora EC-137 TaxID=1314806 RepID=A0ACB8QL20_9AGAM|nr:glutathione S-transferase [Vararia minispora EC-137]